MRMISLSRLLCSLVLAGSPAAASPFGQELEELDADARIDREDVAAYDAARTIGRHLPLARMRPLAATQLATTWAVSNDPLRRAAIAYALEHAWPLGARTVLDHLAHDADPLVRAACAHTVRARRI